jgi:hypothetical protein
MMTELYSNDPLVCWAACWVACREAEAAEPCKRCRRRRILGWAVRGLAVAAAFAVDAVILYGLFR